ncbi:MAG: 50S ribosomal protein L5 [Opitutales bacterium]|nr:50S ribosomal protein L5 [Opitutales bacterium]
MSNTPVLKKIYAEKVVPALEKALNHKNPHNVPNLEKIVVSSGIRSENSKEWVQEVVKEIAKLTGQQPVVTKARKSIANFKLREGQANGVMVTLRGARMWEFLYKFINIVLPSIRDFRGVGTRLDGHGNYSFGVADHTIFPEITVDPNRKNLGMDITIVTTAKNDNEGRELLKLLGMPFRKPNAESATKSEAK